MRLSSSSSSLVLTRPALLPLRRHGYPRAPVEIVARRHPTDARAAHRGRHFSRSDGPGPRHERLPVDAHGRRTGDPSREGGSTHGRI